MKSVVIAAAMLMGLSAAAWGADIEVTNPFIRAVPMAGGTGAAFMTIKNNGGADRLLAAEAGISKTVELHTHVKDGDIFRMRKVEALALPEHGTAELKPGGDHIMFIGVAEPLKEGGTVPLTLKFEKAGAVTVQVPVLAAGAMGPMGPMGGMGGMGGAHDMHGMKH